MTGYLFRDQLTFGDWLTFWWPINFWFPVNFGEQLILLASGQTPLEMAFTHWNVLTELSGVGGSNIGGSISDRPQVRQRALAPCVVRASRPVHVVRAQHGEPPIGGWRGRRTRLRRSQDRPPPSVPPAVHCWCSWKARKRTVPKRRSCPQDDDSDSEMQLQHFQNDYAAAGADGCGASQYDRRERKAWVGLRHVELHKQRKLLYCSSLARERDYMIVLILKVWCSKSSSYMKWG